MAVNPEEKSWTPGTYNRSKDNLKPNYRQVEDKFGYDREDVATPTFGFGKKVRTGIFATIDKIMSGNPSNNRKMTQYKNGELVSGQEDESATGPRVSPLLSSLGENLKDDSGMFQGGRTGRMFGRLRDKIDDYKTGIMNNSKKAVENVDQVSDAGEMPKFDVNNNQQVATMQNMLIQLGYLSGNMEQGEGADGMFGKNTEAAWRAYTNDQRRLRGQEEYVYKNKDIKQELDQGNIGESVETNLDRFGFGTEIENTQVPYNNNMQGPYRY